MIFDLKSFSSEIICENKPTDTEIRTVTEGNELQLYICAKADRPKFVKLHWSCKADENTLVLGDAW